MRLLLDTHTAIWAITTPARLPAHVQAMILEQANEVVVSVASIWEITIKHPLQRGLPSDMPISGTQAVRYFTAAGYRILPITAEHAAAVDDLPALHFDPFDRILVAQAMCEPLRLVTHDERLAAYSETVIRF
jgi:PIN domain nuclease of toxin-antitoxin system